MSFALTERLVQARPRTTPATLRGDLLRAGADIVRKEKVTAFQRTEIKRYRALANPFWRTLWFIPRLAHLYAERVFSLLFSGSGILMSLSVFAWVIRHDLQTFSFHALDRIPFGLIAVGAFANLTFLLAAFAVLILIGSRGWLYSFDNAATYWKRVPLDQIEAKEIPAGVQRSITGAKTLPGTKIEVDVLGADPFVWAVRGGEEECIGYWDAEGFIE
jgi:hypothetical protein